MNKHLIFTLSILFSSFNLSADTLSIMASYSEPSSLQDGGTLYMEAAKGDAYLEITVDGSISNFKYAGLDYENDSLIPGEVITAAAQITDASVVILCSLPEGMPYEGIFWTDSEGNQQAWLIQDHWFSGLGSQNPVLVP